MADQAPSRRDGSAGGESRACQDHRSGWYGTGGAGRPGPEVVWRRVRRTAASRERLVTAGLAMAGQALLRAAGRGRSAAPGVGR